MKKWISLFLAVLMLFSIGAASFAEDASSEDADKQLSLLFQSLSSLKQDESTGTWYYTVTDLDHNGRLELVCAMQNDYSSSVKVYELGEKFDTIVDCTVNLAAGETFPDILRETADTYHDETNDTWYYMFTNGASVGTLGYNSSRCSVSLKDCTLSHSTYATATAQVINGYTAITYTDANGTMITPDEYNAAGANAFIGYAASSTNFDWFLMADATTVSRLTDSYSIFSGAKQPLKIVTPDGQTASSSSQTIVTPVVTAAPAPISNYVTVTKSPTNEYHQEGETAWFISYADNYLSLVWTFVSPYGGEYSYQSFMQLFPACYVSGVNSTTLSIGNVSTDMSGWSVYCTFYGNGQSARSNTAYLYITVKPTPTYTPTPTQAPVGGAMNGTVSDFLMSTVTIALDNGTMVQILKDICYITNAGTLSVGAPCTVYYTGSAPTSNTVTAVTVEGLIGDITSEYDYDYYTGDVDYADDVITITAES